MEAEKRARRRCGSGQRDEVVLADPLEDEEDSGSISSIGHEVRPAGRHRVGLGRLQQNVFLRIAQIHVDAALDDVERVLDGVMEMPGYLLRRAELQLLYPEAGSLGMISTPLNFIRR